MTLVGVELETLVSEPDALTIRPIVFACIRSVCGCSSMSELFYIA